MLLRIFRGNGPGVIVMIVLTLLAVWASAFIKLQRHFSLYFDLDPMPLYGLLSAIIGTNPFPGIIFTIFLVSLLAFSLVNLNTSLFFINERTYLPALFYILLSGLFPQYQLMNPAIFAAMFLMVAIKKIMDTYRVPGIAYNFFDAGILIGTGSLFYAGLIWFGLILIVGMALLRTWDIREIAIALVGLLTPYVITFGIYYLLDKDLRSLFSVMEYNLFGKTSIYAIARLASVTLAFFGIVTLIAFLDLWRVMNIKKIKSRKTFYLLLWIFLISLLMFIIMKSISVEIVWLAGIPASYLLAHYFVFVKKKWIPDIIFSLLFILIALIQILYII